SALMIFTAPGTVIVISRTSMPPARIASAAAIASSADVARTTGMMPTVRMRSTTDTRCPAFHHFLHLGDRGHRRVAGSGHRQRAVSGAALHRPLRSAIGQEAVDQTGGERVAAADAIEDLQIGAGSGLVELAVAPGDRAPVVARGRARDAQRRG